MKCAACIQFELLFGRPPSNNVIQQMKAIPAKKLPSRVRCELYVTHCYGRHVPSGLENAFRLSPARILILRWVDGSGATYKSIVMRADDAARFIVPHQRGSLVHLESSQRGIAGQCGAAPRQRASVCATGRCEHFAGACWLAVWLRVSRRVPCRSHGRGRGRDAPVQGAERHNDRGAGLRSQEGVEAKGLWSQTAVSIGDKADCARWSLSAQRSGRLSQESCLGRRQCRCAMTAYSTGRATRKTWALFQATVSQ